METTFRKVKRGQQQTWSVAASQEHLTARVVFHAATFSPHTERWTKAAQAAMSKGDDILDTCTK